MSWHSSHPDCTCFAVPDTGGNPPTVTPHPIVPLVWHLQFDNAEALVVDGRVLLTCPEFERPCPVHLTPPLGRPMYADQLAMRAFHKSQGCELPLPDEPDDIEGVYPLFGAITRGGPFLSSEPHRGLRQVGAIRLPYLYIRGAGGFHYNDKDSVELAVLQLLSKEVCRASHDTIHR
jgi:hypothetical protein